MFRAGHGELALHRAGESFRILDVGSARENNNCKIVLAVRGDLTVQREKLIALGVAMSEVKSYAGILGPHCDGIDPEGNVFQIVQA